MNAVVHGTNWGAKLRDQPGVYVADGPEQAVDLVEEIMRSDTEIVNLLADVKS